MLLSYFQSKFVIQVFLPNFSWSCLHCQRLTFSGIATKPKLLLSNFISDSVILRAEKLKTFSEINFYSLPLTESVTHELEYLITVCVPFLYPLKTSENHRFFAVFRRYKNVWFYWDLLKLAKILGKSNVLSCREAYIILPLSVKLNFSAGLALLLFDDSLTKLFWMLLFICCLFSMVVWSFFSY